MKKQKNMVKNTSFNPEGMIAIDQPKFNVIIADPPWSCNQIGNYGACKHYDLMTQEQIKATPAFPNWTRLSMCRCWSIPRPRNW